MCHKGAWAELTAKVTSGLGIQSRMHGINDKIRVLLVRGKAAYAVFFFYEKLL